MGGGPRVKGMRGHGLAVGVDTAFCTPYNSSPCSSIKGVYESTLRLVTDWQVKNPNSSVRIRVSKYFTRETRTDWIIYNNKKKGFDISTSHARKSGTAHAQQCQPETQSKIFPHTFLTWISIVHLKLNFKINGVDESKTEHNMTSYNGTITHSKSTVIIQRWRANLTVRIK